MAALKRPVGDRLVLCPQEPLVAGGAAENFERNIRELHRGGDRHLVVDLWLDPRASLEDLSVQLMADGGSVKSVAWEHAKRERP